MGDQPLNFLTHVWVWAAEAPERLGPKIRKELADPKNGRTVCCVPTLEIARLVAGGDIVLKVPLADWVEQTLNDLRAESIPVSHEIAVEGVSIARAFPQGSGGPPNRRLLAAARAAIGNSR